MIQRDVLFQVLDALDALNIPHMVVGSFASSLCAIARLRTDEPRESLEDVESILQEAGKLDE